MGERVFAVVSVFENLPLLPHFLKHYSSLDVDRILVAVRTPECDGIYEEASALARGFPAQVTWRACKFFADSDRSEVELELLSRAELDPDDYVMHLDLDEFQEYPAHLREIIGGMNAHDDWALRGWIVDRVADGGALAEIHSEPSIWLQYPITCDLTDKLLGAWTQRIVLSRWRVELQGGVHHDTVNARYHRVPVGSADQYLVHHFKWTAGLIERIRHRLQTAAIGSIYRRECECLLERCGNGGLIDLGDPAFRARLVGDFVYPIRETRTT